MEDGKHYPVNHKVMPLTYESAFGTGKKSETWIWDIYTVDLSNGNWLVRLEYSQGTDSIRKNSIGWMKVKGAELSVRLKEICLSEMKRVIG